MPGRLRSRAGFDAGQASMPGRRGRHQAAEPSQSPGPCYTSYMCYMALTRQAAEPSQSPVLAIRPICAIWLLQGKPPNPHSLRAPCYTSYMCYMALTRQAAEPSQSPGSLLYVLYVLYGSYKASCRVYTIHIASQHVPKMHCIAHIVYFNARLDNI